MDAHIIPNFMYKELFDEDHSLRYANPYIPSDKPKVAFTGENDNNILCRTCDGQLNRLYESYD